MFPGTFGFGYKILLLLHLVSVVVAFSGAMSWSISAAKVKREGGDPDGVLAKLVAGSSARIYGPAMALAGIFGAGAVGVSDKIWQFSDAWVSTGLLLWFLALGVIFGLIVPGEKRLATGDQSAAKILSMAAGILNLLLVVLIVDMIWKPGY